MRIGVTFTALTLLTLSLLFSAAGCNPTPHGVVRSPDDTTSTCGAVLSPTISDAQVRSALEGITPASFGDDVREIEGVRDGTTPALAHAAMYFEKVMRESGFTVTRQLVRASGEGAIHENIIAERRALRDHENAPILIATAHIDTVARSPGADDNATGIATLLAIARAMSSAGSTPTTSATAIANATTRLVAFALEEEGFIGSRAYVQSLRWEERARIRAVYNFDMIGFMRHGEGSQEWPSDAQILADIRGRPLRRTGDFIGAVTLTSPQSGPKSRFSAQTTFSPLAPLHEARRYVPHLNVETIEFPRVLLRFAPDLERGDHVPFWAIDVPAVDIGDTAELRNPNYHAPSDTVATLDLAFGSSVARWAAAGILLSASHACHPNGRLARDDNSR